MRQAARRLAWVLGFTLALPALAQDANAWLARMGQAMTGLDYQGDVVYLHGSQLEALRVFHAVDAAGTRERLVSLSGAPREIVRGAGQVLLAGSRPRAAIYGEAGLLQPQLLAALGADPARLPRHYTLVLGGTDRIAGLATQLVEVRPRDAFRYGYRLWLENDTGMLLKSVRFGADGRPVEQLMFTRIALRERPSETDLAGAPVENPLPNPMPLPQAPPPPDAGWYIANPPDGFELAARQPTASAAGEHLVFSDGLANVSVYVEPLTGAAPAFTGLSSRGAVNLYGRVLDGHQITVLGEVPPATVARFAQGVMPAAGG
jgi:sigma-E factor negative regulatory protein RseB